MNNLKANVIQYYIINNFIRVLSLLLKDNNISQESKDYIINSLYEVYLSSSSANKNKLIDLYIKYSIEQLLKKVLFDSSISYAKIDHICSAIKSSDNSAIKLWLDNFLDYDHLLENNFIRSYLTQSSYIFLNTDISSLFDEYSLSDIPDITLQSFIRQLVLNYTPSLHEEWLDYIIDNTSLHDLLMALWVGGIQFSSNQLKSIDDLNFDVSYNDRLVNVIKLYFANYVRSECLNIVENLYTNDKLGASEYLSIDTFGSDDFLYLLSQSYSHISTDTTYNSSLLKKINDYGLVNLFEYLFTNDDYNKSISLSDQDYLLGRPDCSTTIKIKLLSHYNLDSLNDIDLDVYPNLYTYIFNFNIYDPFIKGIRGEEGGFDADKLYINSNSYLTSITTIAPEEDLYDIIEYSVDSEHPLTNLFNCIIQNRLDNDSPKWLLTQLDESLAYRMATSVSSPSNAKQLAALSVDNEMYNTLCFTLYGEYTFDTSDIDFTSLDNGIFTEKLVSTLSTFDKLQFKDKSYKLLNYGDKLFEEFLYLVLNKLSNDDCYDFCFTDDLSGNYSCFRDYLCDKFDSDNDNYGFNCYFKNIPWDIKSKWDSEEFGKIDQSVYENYDSYVSAYTNNISVLAYYDPNNLNLVHPNRMIIENVNVLWNIIIYLAFNKANSNNYTAGSLRNVESCLYHMLRPNEDLINDTYSLYSANNISALYNPYIITAISDTVNRCSNINGLLNVMLDKHDNSLYWKASIEDNVESFLLFVYYNKSQLANVIDSTCNRIISLVNSCYYYNYDFYYSILNHCIDFYDLPQYKGVWDKIAYASLKYVSQLPWNTLASANCYAAIAYKLINYESGSYIPNDVKHYIQNNWKKLIPYLTEGYTKILVSTSVSSTDIVTIEDYTQNSISELLSNYNPWSGALADTGAQLSECYIRLAKYYISEAIPDISFDDVYEVIYTPYNGTLLHDYEVTRTFRLSHEPTDTVTLTFTANNNAIDMDKTTLTFTQSDWSTSQDITFKLNDSSSVVDSSVEVIAHVSSGDVNYNGIEFTPFKSAIESNLTAGIICSSNYINITEGSSATVNFKLISRPSDNVVLSFTSASSSVILPPSISFSQLNWNTPQPVTFSVNNNNTVDGNVTADVVVSSSSNDQLYNGLSNALHITIIDGNTADIDCGSPTISLSSSTSVTRLIKLTSQPTHTVTINISSSNDSIVISHSQLSLTQSNWNTGVQVTFSVANNANSQTAEILLSASSQDTNYNNLSKHITATILSESIGVTAFTTSTFAINTDISAIIEADQGITVDFPQIYNNF